MHRSQLSLGFSFPGITTARMIGSSLHSVIDGQERK
jgi:hypothetical protein